MKCQNPFWGAGTRLDRKVPYPCGQCLSCRINRRRTWQHRIMLEALQHTDNSFLTLTYRDEELPRTKERKLPTLSPRHLQLWLKRLRKALAPLKVRFFAVGEYGEQTWRPHYHVILFGFPPCCYQMTRVHQVKLNGFCCPQCDLIQKTWGHGQVYVGTLSQQSAQYVAGYTIKKLTAADDARLAGRRAEFSRQSRDGGIGLGAVPEIASAMLALDLEKTEDDVPVALRHGSKQYPLGQYLRRKLREHLGRDSKTPLAILQQLEEGEVQSMRTVAFNGSLSLSETYKQVFQGEFEKVNVRHNLFKRKDKL